MKKFTLLLLFFCMGAFLLAGCNKTATTSESTVVAETVDKFAVNDVIDIEDISVESEDSSEVSLEGQLADEGMQSDIVSGDNGKIQESINDSVDEINTKLLESSSEGVINSDDVIDIIAYFDRVEGDYLYVKSDLEGEGIIEYKLYITAVRDGVDPAEKGDALYITYNGYTDESNTLVKVYKVMNISSVERIEAEAEIVEEIETAEVEIVE